MSELYFAVTVTDRRRLGDFMEVYKDGGMSVNFVTLAYGTAKSELLDTLGLDSTERAVCFSFVTDTTWESVKNVLEKRLRVDVPGTGIVFTVPMSSISGKRELMFLTQGQDYRKGDEATLKNTDHELIIVICERGHSETVMDAARAAGATGGTVVHAKGTGMNHAEQFLGITLANEKDLIFIVTKAEKKNDIMKCVNENAGKTTRAKAICFSLPVTDTAGLRLTEV